MELGYAEGENKASSGYCKAQNGVLKRFKDFVQLRGEAVFIIGSLNQMQISLSLKMNIKKSQTRVIT
jgi:hypothetical protein